MNKKVKTVIAFLAATVVWVASVIFSSLWIVAPAAIVAFALACRSMYRTFNMTKITVVAHVFGILVGMVLAMHIMSLAIPQPILKARLETFEKPACALADMHARTLTITALAHDKAKVEAVIHNGCRVSATPKLAVTLRDAHTERPISNDDILLEPYQIGPGQDHTYLFTLPVDKNSVVVNVQIAGLQ